MKKPVSVLLAIIIIFFTTAIPFGESAQQQVESGSSLFIGSASLSLGNEFFIKETEDGYLEVYHKSKLFSAVVSCDEMDEQTLELLRKYYNDYASDENYMFQKFTEYIKSYFNAMEDLFHNQFLYPEEGKYNESSMRVFGRYTEDNLNENSYSILYNTIYTDKFESVEKTHINIAIPVSSQKTVYSLSLTCMRGQLDDSVMKDMLSLVNSLVIPGIKVQAKTLNVFTDKASVKLANLGIYPDLENMAITYDTLINKNSGYSIKYPSSFIKYRVNNVTDTLDYVSFKINYNHTISVSAEKMNYNSPRIDKKLDLLKNAYADKLSIWEEGTVNIEEKELRYIKYEISSAEGSTYVQDYYTTHGSTLYSISLNSRFIQPTASIEREMHNMLLSLQFTDSNLMNSAADAQASSDFDIKEKEYTFSYPKGWKVTKDISSDINHDAFILEAPGNSSPLEVIVSESQLSENVFSSEVTFSFTEAKPVSINSLFDGYKAPYMNKTFTILHTSVYEAYGTINIKRLVNYLDSSGRNRMCYSMDIITGRDVYSLFISLPDYVFSVDNREFQESVATTASLISNSFRLKGEVFTECALFLRDLLKTDIKGSFPYPDTFEYVCANENLYYVPVYIEFYNISGYFILSIDTVNDKIDTVFFKSQEDIINDIENWWKNSITRLETSDNDYRIVECRVNAANKFEYEVFLKSDCDDSCIIKKMKLTLNNDTLILIPQ